MVVGPYTSESGWDQVGPWTSQDTTPGAGVKSPTEKGLSSEVQLLLRLLDT